MIPSLTIHSKALESIICQLITEKHRRIFPSYFGHDTYSCMTGNKYIIISVLDDFIDITNEQKESYRSFIRNSVNSILSKILIIAKKGNKAHSCFLKEILPNKFENVRVRFTIGSDNLTEQIADHVNDFLYGKPDEGFSTNITMAELRWRIEECTACGEKLYLPTDILLCNKDKKYVGKIITGDWTENICANVRLIIPHFIIKEGKFAPLIFRNMQPSFLCPACAETVEMKKGICQSCIAKPFTLTLNYDDICKIQLIENNMH